MNTTTTPEGHTITPRDIAFGRDEKMERWWVGGDPIATCWFNALSVTFPLGERFFMDSVKRYRDGAEPKLKEEIKAFLTQEAVHSREHVFFNRQVADHGYDMDALEERVRSRLKFARAFPDYAQLGATCALEHFTAIMANALLEEPKYLKGASDEEQRMWRWHAIEEIEHKAVAYDTYVDVATRNWWGIRRYVARCVVMTATTFIFFNVIRKNMRDLYKADGIDTPETWRKTRAYLFGKGGFVRHAMKDYFSWFRPGFHPWQHDDRELIAEVERDLATAAAAA